MKIETRVLEEQMNVEWREAGGGEREAIVEGYAARFNVRSVDLGGFREVIEPGAFRGVLRDKNTDVRATFNHNMSVVLGRQGSKTLEVKEDKRGLFYRLRLPDTTQARDLVTSMQRGDIAHSSFMFAGARDSWTTEKVDGMSFELRTVHEVSRLFDVSIVTMPAYPDASAHVVKRMANIDAALESRSAWLTENRKQKAAAARAKAIAELGVF